MHESRILSHKMAPGAIMPVEKLPSGAYRIYKQVNGRRYRITVDHNPTKKEAEKLLREAINEGGDSPVANLTINEAIKSYIQSKSNVVSPSTIRGYESIQRNLPDDLLRLKLAKITNIQVQKYINEYAENRSPKSVHNAYGLLASVLGLFRPELRLKVTLPQLEDKDVYIPTDEDIAKLCAAAKGTRYWIPVALGAYGLRRSEICAITAEQLNGCDLTIDRAMVQDKEYNWIIKTTKTRKSTRTITISPELAEAIREQGYAYDGAPNRIYIWLTETENALGIPHFSLHKLRHYFATVMSSVMPEADVLYLGGWSTPKVMNSIYRHERISKEAEMRKQASDFIFSKLNQPENSPETD